MIEEGLRPITDLPGVARTTCHGLPCIRVDTPDASGLVYLQGAHVAEWVPRGHQSVIWISEQAVYQPGKAIRGGIPICFPWFGPHPERSEFPAHGFARTREFDYLGAGHDSTGRSELAFSLRHDQASHAFFPHDFELCLRVAFGETLGLRLSVTNQGTEPFSFEEALHSYFSVAQVASAVVLGLEGATFIDKVRGNAVFSEDSAELRLTGETDRVYTSAAACTIRDLEAGRAIRIDKQHSAATVVWNPWAAKAEKMADLGGSAWPHLLCIESANVGDARITLAPGEEHQLAVELSVAET
jgi:glucose-6-phosphate 1-epimerase